MHYQVKIKKSCWNVERLDRKLLSNSVCKESPAVLPVVQESQGSDLSSHTRHNVFNLLLAEKLGNFSWRERHRHNLKPTISTSSKLMMYIYADIFIAMMTCSLGQTLLKHCGYQGNWLWPDANKSLIMTRNCSSGICASVRSRAMRWFFTPVLMNKTARSI